MASAGEKYPTNSDMARTIADLTARLEKLERADPKNQVVFYDSQGGRSCELEPILTLGNAASK